jgi:hypothetical protein
MSLFGGQLQLDFDISGSVTSTDSLLYLSCSNPADTIDIGWYGSYISSGLKYAGMFRDATDGAFKLFKDMTTPPTNNVVAAVSTFADLSVNTIIVNAGTASQYLALDSNKKIISVPSSGVISDAYIRSLFSESDANLTYDNSTGVFGFASSPTFTNETLTGALQCKGLATIGYDFGVSGGVKISTAAYGKPTVEALTSALATETLYLNPAGGVIQTGSGGFLSRGITAIGYESGVNAGIRITRNTYAKPSIESLTSAGAAENMYLNPTGGIVSIGTVATIGTTTSNGSLTVSKGVNSAVPTLGTTTGALAIHGDATSYGLFAGVVNTGSSWIQAMRCDATATAYALLLNPSGGNVAVGSSSPTNTLDVWNNANSAGYNQVGNFVVTNNLGGTNYSRFTIGQISTNVMALEAANQANTKGTLALQNYGGNVAVGTGASSVSGIVLQNTYGYISFNNNYTYGSYSISCVSGSGNYPLRFVTSSDAGTPRPFEFGYYASDNTANAFTRAMTIFPVSNYVGIGTASPSAMLHVSAATGGAGIGILEDRSTGAADIQLQFRSQYAPLANGSKICGSIVSAPSNTGGRLLLYTAQNTTGTLTERMRIDDFGYINFGTGSTGLNFGTTDSSTGFWIRNDGFNTVISTKIGSMYYGLSGSSGISHFFYSGSGPSETMRVSDGKVGIGVSPSYLLHVSGSQTNTVNIVFNSTTTAPGTNANMYGLIHYSNLNFVSGSTNYGTGQYLGLTMNVPAATTVLHAASIVCVQPTNSGAGSVTYARSLQVGNPTVGTACNIATWTSNISVGDGYFSTTPPTNGLLVQGSVGIGITPVAKFHVSAGVGAPTSFSNYSLLMYSSGTASTSYGFGIDSSTVWYNSEIYHQWFASGSSKMTLDGSGNLSPSGYVAATAIAGALSDVSTAFATTTSYAKLTIFGTSRLASNMTVSTVNNRISVIVAGTYKMSFCGDIFQTSGADRTVSVVFYKNGSVYSSAAFAATGQSSKYACIAGEDIATLNVNDYLEIYVKIDTNTTVTYNAMMFMVHRL